MLACDPLRLNSSLDACRNVSRQGFKSLSPQQRYEVLVAEQVNLARRQHRAIDLLHDIQGLKRRGYNNTTIAQKTGLTIEYVKAVLRLLAERRTSVAARCRGQSASG